MLAVVAHHSWSTPGGGELVCASTVVALDAMGISPTLSGVFKFNPAKYKEWFGIDLEKYPIVTLPIESGFIGSGLLRDLLMWLPARKALKKSKASLLFIDGPAYKPLATRKRKYKIVEYIHFPYEAVIDFAHIEDPHVRLYSIFPLDLYWKIYRWGFYTLSRGNPFYAADLVLANSKWTAGVVKSVYGESPIVLNPPIAPNVEVVDSPKPFEERKPAIVMIGRFSHEKKYGWVVGELMPRLIKEVPEVRVYIYGGLSSRAYYEEVKMIAEKRGVSRHLVLVTNAPRVEINNAMDRSRVFLHATINEHWGIAVAEAMARGLPTVVHKSGGAWTDLTRGGTVGVGYESVEEAVEHLLKLITDPKTWRHYSQKSLERARELTLHHYITNLTQQLKKSNII
ncbi:MAG: glycosyltransferase family 4 protein [Zestosphaera sp.]